MGGGEGERVKDNLKVISRPLCTAKCPHLLVSPGGMHFLTFTIETILKFKAQKFPEVVHFPTFRQDELSIESCISVPFFFGGGGGNRPTVKW